jgi:hypothetical protein
MSAASCPAPRCFFANPQVRFESRIFLGGFNLLFRFLGPRQATIRSDWSFPVHVPLALAAITPLCSAFFLIKREFDRSQGNALAEDVIPVIPSSFATHLSMSLDRPAYVKPWFNGKLILATCSDFADRVPVDRRSFDYPTVGSSTHLPTQTTYY